MKTPLALLLLTGAVVGVCVVGASEIGDGRSSKASSDQFFRSVDENGDGKIVASEIREFVQGVGHSSLDEEKEITRSIETVFEYVDGNADNKVDRRDLEDYWKHLGELLSVEEVAAWVKYAVQLPEEVANVFASNRVSGYDFPELLANDGALLESELGITQSAYKKRLLRGMRMKMMGVGHVPDVPFPFQAVSDSCRSIHLHWGKQYTLAFPVHMYRLLRKEKSKNESPSTTDTFKFACIYEGSANGFTDTGLAREKTYTYMLEAWNALGRSEQVMVEGRTVASPCPSEGPHSFVLNALGLLYRSVINTLQFVFIAVGVVGAYFRFRRATGIVSTFAIFRVLWSLQNVILHLLSKVIPIPETMMTDIDALTQVEETGDVTSASVGLGIVKNFEPGDNGEQIADIASKHFVLGRIKPHAAYDSATADAAAEEASKCCVICKAKFKLGFKTRHICTKCLSPFCGACGLVTHSNVFACPVRGGCMCRNCNPTPQPALKRSVKRAFSTGALSRGSSLDDTPGQLLKSKSHRFSFTKWKQS